MDDALIFAGCVNFLAFLKEDPDIWALYNSAAVQTIFAVGDKYFNSASSKVKARLMARDLTAAQVQKAQLAAGKAETDLARLRKIPGSTVATNDASADLRGSTQVIVSDYRRLNSKTSTRRDSNSSVSTNSTTTNALVTLYSGLGDSVSLYNSDISYAGGVIQVLDGFFTIPASLSESTEILGYNGFANVVDEVGLTATLDNTSSITVFIPNNAAVQSAQLTSSSDLLTIVEDHVVVATSDTDTVGYLPNLADGQVLTTKNGKELTITVDANNNYYVNGILITTSNIVLTNGVAHVIDDVLVASASASDGGFSLRSAGSSSLAIIASALTILLVL